MAGKNTTISGAVTARDFVNLCEMLESLDTSMTLSGFVNYCTVLGICLGAQRFSLMAEAGPEETAKFIGSVVDQYLTPKKGTHTELA